MYLFDVPRHFKRPLPVATSGVCGGVLPRRLVMEEAENVRKTSSGYIFDGSRSAMADVLCFIVLGGGGGGEAVRLQASKNKGFDGSLPRDAVLELLCPLGG